MKTLIAIVVVGLLILFGKSYLKSEASSEELAKVNQAIEESKGQPYEVEFKSKIEPLVKDGITVSEAVDILRIYEQVRIKNNLTSK